MSRKLALGMGLALLIGCKSGTPETPLVSQTQQPSEALVQQPSEALVQQAVNSTQDKGFSIKKVMGLAGFMRPRSDEGLVPSQVVQLTAAVNTVVSKAAELNANDPPQLTAQKAQGLLDTLRPWDGLMATAKSMGLVTEETAAPLQALVDQLRLQTNNLIEFGGHPETIASVKHLAGQLKTAGNSIVSMFAPQGF